MCLQVIIQFPQHRDRTLRRNSDVQKFLNMCKNDPLITTIPIFQDFTGRLIVIRCHRKSLNSLFASPCNYDNRYENFDTTGKSESWTFTLNWSQKLCHSKTLPLNFGKVNFGNLASAAETQVDLSAASWSLCVSSSYLLAALTRLTRLLTKISGFIYTVK